MRSSGVCGLVLAYGGLKAVALTDIIQVVILILGGFAITWLALDAVGLGEGAIAGLQRLSEEVPGHFVMILDSSNPSYSNLPGIQPLLGGLWVLHFSYWGFNQYIIQRALGAESLAEAQKGLAFAAFLKLLIPLIVVVPGIAALVLAQDGAMSASVLTETPDRTYGELMKLAPDGLRGLVFAALIAAIVSSLASMMNSDCNDFHHGYLSPVCVYRSSGITLRNGRAGRRVRCDGYCACARETLFGWHGERLPNDSGIHWVYRPRRRHHFPADSLPARQ